MKKIVYIIVVIGVVFGLYALATGITSKDPKPTENKPDYTQKIEDTLSNYCLAKDNLEDFAADDILAKDIALYLQDKVKTEQRVNELKNDKKENYKATVKLLENTSESDANMVLLQYQLLATFNYTGVDFTTTTSNVCDVVYDKSKGKVVDVYDTQNYYDNFVRENTTAPSQYKNISELKGFVLTEDIVNRQKELHKEIDGKKWK